MIVGECVGQTIYHTFWLRDGLTDAVFQPCLLRFYMTTFNHFIAWFLCGLIGFLLSLGIPVLGQIAWGIFFFCLVTPVWMFYLIVTEQPDPVGPRSKEESEGQEESQK